jgi:hypothetical protein
MSMDDAHDVPAPRGHLHGRLLKVLGGASAIAIAIALWQFGVFGDDTDGDPVGAVEGLDAPWIADGTEASSPPDLAEASSAAIDSPSESTAADDETTAAPSSEITPTPSSTATEDADQEVATETACSASLALTREWDGGIEVSGTVVNTGSEAIESWEIDLAFAGAEIYHYWDMRQLDGDRYTNEDWNGRLEPNGNAKLGFLANTDSDFELPDSVPCTAKA